MTTNGVREPPEYLINQSSHTCLSVISGSTARDAVVGMDKCSGSIKQQWFYVNGKWQWGGNRTLCLAQDRRTRAICLQPCNSVTGSWTYDQDGRLVFGSQALDLPWQKPRTRVALFAKHAGMNQKWWTLSLLQKILEDGGLLKQFDCKCQGKPPLTDVSLGEDPKYLLNQSTRTCLTVLSGTEPSNAIIGLAPYTGTIKQQWFDKEGQWLWGGNRTFCLMPDTESGKLSLIDSNDSTTSWVFDQEGYLMCESNALDLTSEGEEEKLSMLPKQDGMNQKWLIHTNKNACFGLNVYPFSANDEQLYKQEIARGILNKLCCLPNDVPHPRNVAHYPGTVAPTTPRIDISCTLTVGTVVQAKNLRMTAPEDWQATNIYVAAGDIFKVILPETLTEKQATQITIRVGAQCDCLDPTSPNLKNSVFKRMPVISEEFEVTPGINILRSQYGGNLIFTYAGEESFQIDAEVQNVIEAPHYVLGKTSKNDWDFMKEFSTPFAILESGKAVLFTRTSEVKRVTDIDGLLKRYDDIISKLEDLSGFTENDPPPQGKQWLVNDVQITAGSAHAGFPAMFDRQFYDLTSPKTPHDWVVWHELGHNYQQGPFWSNAYGSETTVNLFSLFIEEKITAGDRLRKEKRYISTGNAVDKGLTFDKADHWQKLVFLMEIKHAFPNHGWDIYRHLNRTTRALSETEASTLRSDLQKQFDFVYKTISCLVGADLLPHYQRWGLPVSQQAQNEVKSLNLPNAPANLTAKSLK